MLKYGIVHQGYVFYPNEKREKFDRADLKICVICDDDCIAKIAYTDRGIATGFALDDNDNPVCYECCGKEDLKNMLESGKATLYLSFKGGNSIWTTEYCELTNWPSTMKIIPRFVQIGRHNIARKRIDVWFKIENDSFVWHGVQYGENTQIVHCKRTKRMEF